VAFEQVIATGPGESITIVDGRPDAAPSAEGEGAEGDGAEGAKKSGCGFDAPEPGTACFFPAVSHAEPKFAKILRFSGGHPHYLQFLIVGIIVWHFLSLCLNDSMGAIIGNANLVKRAAFPRIILPLSTVLANLVNFLLTVVVLVVYLLLAGIAPGVLPWFLVAVLTQVALCLGLCLILCTLNVFFRDTEHILSILTMAWFFMTPIFYSLKLQLDALPDRLHSLVFLNPMTGIVCACRSALMAEPLPALSSLALSFAVSWGVCLVGIVCFQGLQHRFADEL
jgi:lipopolysaccharide transport system permease protein